MLKCPNCNGSLIFDVKSQELLCEHCGSNFDPTTYADDNAADYDAVVYTCRNCGARLITANESVTAFCSYCGGENILDAKFTKETRPKYLIPFKVTKEDIKKSYTDYTKSLLYCPSELQDDQFLEKFRGIYVPYWNFVVGFADSIDLDGTASYTKGDYVYNEKYDLKIAIDGDYHGVPYDASSNFDDTIAEKIAPYSQRDYVPFEIGYLGGFYADTSDVNPEIYEGDVINRSTEFLMNDISKSYATAKVTPVFPKRDKFVEKVNPSIREEYATLLPVWFLTWRKRNRVAYAIINGQSGEIHADVPIDYKKYFGSVAVVAAILFVLFTLFVSMTAPTALGLSSVMACAVSAILFYEMREIKERETHLFDRGYFVIERGRTISLKSVDRAIRKRFKENSVFTTKTFRNVFMGIIMGFFLMLVLPVVVIGAFTGLPGERALFITCVALIVNIVYFIRSLLLLWKFPRKRIYFYTLITTIAVWAAFLLAATQPVNDIWYYSGCIGCMAAVFISSVGMIRYYNYSITRALPSFFDREGGRDNA